MSDRLDQRCLQHLGYARLCALALGASFVVALVTGPSFAVASAATPGAALEISFDTAASVRLRGQRFVGLRGADLTAVNSVLDAHSVVRVERLFRGSETSLDALRERVRGKG